jgi:SAM-dependent methyltransferase
MIKTTIPSNDFYRAFEDRYRGSRELIKSRLEIYLPFTEKIKDFDTKPNAIDLGCGRGEWLELLSENGYLMQGVDLDAGMLESCRSKGLQATQKDAMEALKELSDSSCSIVSGFHIAEHLPFDTLQLLIQEALRVLKPGGLLILETPNAENIQVATASFYLDPTHIRPIPSQLLSFLTEHYGFWRTKVLRLQESKELHDAMSATLMQVIIGVSPDYAVIAQKQAHNEIVSNFDELFNKEYGLSLETLVNRFENRLSSIQAQASQADIKATQAQAQATQAQAQANQADMKATQAQTQAAQAWHHYIMVVNSRSWKVTKPLRIAGKIARWFILGATAWLTFSPASRPRKTLKNLALKIKKHINAHPKLKMQITNILNHFPSLKARLKRIGVAPYPLQGIHYPISQDTLSPRTKKIYNDLNAAIEKKQKEVQ